MFFQRIKKLCLIFIMIVCIFTFTWRVSFAQYTLFFNHTPYNDQNSSYYKQKDPFIAGLLSWFMMGVGQIYVQEYTKGSLFIAANMIDKASLILLISHINNKYSPSSGETIYVNWKEFNSGTKFLIISYFSATLGLRFYSAFDAYNSAKKYNDRYSPQMDQEGFSFDYKEDTFSLRYTFQFSE